MRDHGVYTNWEEIAPDSPTYVRALREAGYHTSLLGKAHLYLDENLPVAHMDEMAGRLEALGFAEVFETGDKFMPKIPTRYSDYLAAEGLLDAYREHIADRTYQGDNEDGQNATKCVPMWDSTPMPIPLESYVDTWHGAQAVRWIEDYERDAPFFLFVGFPGPHDPWDAPAEAVARYDGVDISMPASTKRPVVEGTGRYGSAAAGVPLALGHRDHDRRRHPGHAAGVRRRHLGDRPRGRAHRRCAGAQGLLGLDAGSCTRPTTARWPGATGSCRSACCTSRRCACR